MVQATEDRRRVDGESTPCGSAGIVARVGSGKPGPKGRVRTTAIVIGDEFLKDNTEMALVERNQVIETLPPNGSDQTFQKALAVGARTGVFSTRIRNSLRV